MPIDTYMFEYEVVNGIECGGEVKYCEDYVFYIIEVCENFLYS